MKTSLKIIFGAGALLLAVIGFAWLGTNSSAETSVANAAAAPVTVADPAPVPPAPDASTPPKTLVPATLPPGITPGSPLAQVIKLTQADIDQGIILTFVTNSIGTFNLDSDRIIYLADLGVPNELVTAMMQHDLQLKQQSAQAAQVAQAAQTPSAPAPADNVVQTDPGPGTMTEVIPAPPTSEVTVDYFNSTLAPYGSWVEVAGYGRCWRPSVVIYDSNWQPYANGGHWVYTDSGWYWQSDYSWGATFHYGRWFHDPRVGWCWWPDTQWSPSWLTWRYSGDYCGWSPLPPFTSYRSGVGFFYRGSAVSVGFDFGLGASSFTFVSTRNVFDRHPYQHRVDRAQVTQIYNQTTVINNFNGNGRNRTVINGGIAPDRISAVTHAPIRPVTLGEPGNRGQRDSQRGTQPGRGAQAGRDTQVPTLNHSTPTVNPAPVVRQTTMPQPAPTVTATAPAQVTPGRTIDNRANRTPGVENTPANRFQQPGAVQNPQTIRNITEPQTQAPFQGNGSPVYSGDNVNRGGTVQPVQRAAPPVINPAPSSPTTAFQAPPVNPPRNEQPANQRTFPPREAVTPPVIAPAQNQIGAPYSAPRSVTPQPNYAPNIPTHNGSANPAYIPPAPMNPRAGNGAPAPAQPQQNPGRSRSNQNGQPN